MPLVNPHRNNRTLVISQNGDSEAMRPRPDQLSTWRSLFRRTTPCSSQRSWYNTRRRSTMRRREGDAWEAALARTGTAAAAKTSVGAGDSVDAPLATPHPANSSSAEAAAWEAALNMHSPSGRRPLVAVIECGCVAERVCLATPGCRRASSLSSPTQDHPNHPQVSFNAPADHRRSH